MMDWYLGQAGFGEQLERYGDAYWRQMGGTLLWAFIVIWVLLIFVAIVAALTRRADVNRRTGSRRTGSERAFDRVLTATHTRALVRRARAPSKEPPDNTVVPPKVA